MATSTLEPVLQHIRRLCDGANADQLVDGQLLERFATKHDQIAFEALLRRHGPLVLGVCRRVLHDSHTADDVFQATFLMLVRKARSLDRRSSLAGWLSTVAFRLALRRSRL